MGKILRVYLDTSVIGGCCDDEFREYSNQLLEEFGKGLFQAVVSELTDVEIARAPDEVVKIYQKLMEIGCEVLEITDDGERLADKYLSRKIVTPQYRNDALHIAIATINNIDILVSWNFKHIVHYEKIRMFNAVNLEDGYRMIEIYSPMEVVSHGD